MNKELNKIKILYFVDSPADKHPRKYWINPWNEMLELSKTCEVHCVSPARVSIVEFAKNLLGIGKSEQLQPYFLEGPIRVYRPRYISFPLMGGNNDLTLAIIIMRLLIFIALNKRYDIIHGNFIFWPGLVAAIAGKIFNIPVVLTATGSDIFVNLYEEGRYFRKRTLWALKIADKIIAMSGYLQKILAKEGFADQTTVNSHGYNCELFKPMDRRACRIKLGLPLERRLILFVGHLIRIKGADILIEAFLQLRRTNADCALLIIGEGSQKDMLQQLAIKAGLQDQAQFLGAKEHEEIPFYMNAADVLAVPSRNDSRSLVAIEALACGLPLAASAVGGIPETITDSRLGFLAESENPTDFARAVSSALAQTDYRQYRVEYAKRFCSENLVRNVMKLYEELVANRHKKQRCTGDI